jgi:hypothetical protein
MRLTTQLTDAAAASLTEAYAGALRTRLRAVPSPAGREFGVARQRALQLIGDLDFAAPVVRTAAARQLYRRSSTSALYERWAAARNLRSGRQRPRVTPSGGPVGQTWLVGTAFAAFSGNPLQDNAIEKRGAATGSEMPGCACDDQRDRDATQ